MILSIVQSPTSDQSFVGWEPAEIPPEAAVQCAMACRTGRGPAVVPYNKNPRSSRRVTPALERSKPRGLDPNDAAA